MRRQRVRKPMKTGIRVIDLFTPLCAGQRIGIFAGSGVGKSTLLSMLARASGFDTAVLALVGERGREVREFLEDALGRERARTHCRGLDGRREPDDAPPRAEDGDVHRRASARPGRERAADRRFGDALRPCRARRGPRRRRAPGGARLSAERVQRPAASCWSGRGPERRARARSPASSPCSSTATTTTIRSPTASAARWTGTSCSTARSPSRADIRP